MSAVLHKYVAIFADGKPLSEEQKKHVFEMIQFIRTASSWDGSERKTPEQEAEDRKAATEKWDYIRTLRFEDSRAPGVAIHWQDVVFSLQLKLTDQDFQRMNLPAEFRGDYQLSGATAEPLRQYIRSLSTVLQDGIGVFLYGPAKTGKTRSAAALAKAIAGYRRLVYFTTPADFREHIRTRSEFEGGLSVIEMCKKVEFLVFDNLVKPDPKDVFLTTAVLEDLMKTRKSWKRPTILTSRLTPLELVDYFPDTLDVMNTASLMLECRQIYDPPAPQSAIKSLLGIKK